MTWLSHNHATFQDSYFLLHETWMPHNYVKHKHAIVIFNTYRLHDKIWNVGRLRIILVLHWPIPVPARLKALVCGCSFAGIAGLNSVGGMYVCLLWVVCCQVEVSASDWSLVQNPTGCHVSECDREASIMRRPRPIRGSCALGGGNHTLLSTMQIAVLYCTIRPRHSINRSRCNSERSLRIFNRWAH